MAINTIFTENLRFSLKVINDLLNNLHLRKCHYLFFTHAIDFPISVLNDGSLICKTKRGHRQIFFICEKNALITFFTISSKISPYIILCILLH